MEAAAEGTAEATAARTLGTSRVKPSILRIAGWNSSVPAAADLVCGEGSSSPRHSQQVTRFDTQTMDTALRCGAVWKQKK